jgi:DNA repair protein RadA
MATKSKKKAKTELENNESPTDEAPVMKPTEEEVPEPLIEDLPGVGPATAEKLREAGFDDLLALAVMSPGDLADQAELGEAVATKIIGGAKKMANIGVFVSGGALVGRRRI